MAIELRTVEQLALDQASLKAAAGLAKPAKWSNVGASPDEALVWGECAGSGANPYRVMADLRDFGNKCTCPSRKFPCKHVLALFWLRAEGLVAFPTAETPDWVMDWLRRRRPSDAAAKAGAAANAPATPRETKDLAGAAIAEPTPIEDAKATARREAASAKRAEDTQQAILEALAALEQWVGDQLRLGLGGFIDDVTARCRRIGSRLVDGKAAALAGHIDELPARLLALPAGHRVRGATVELARLVLLARAYRADPTDPDIRRAVATTESREVLLANPAALRVAATWEVLAEQVRTRRDGLISHTTWLLNLDEEGPRFAMLLDFHSAAMGRRGSVFTPGEQFRGDLVFYPARTPLRAILMRRERVPEGQMVAWPTAASASLDEALTAPMLDEPWTVEWPVLLAGGRIGFDTADTPWWQPSDGDGPLPLAGEVAGLITGTELTSAAALWSGNRLELLAAQTPWGRVGDA